METIKFGDWETSFPIKSIQPVAVHVLRIIFDDVMPDENGYSKPITVYTQGGIKSTVLEGWTTIYYMDKDNKTVYLSDDGSVYTEPEETEPEPEPEPYEPTIEELQESKIATMQAACNREITAGIDVNGEHFSLGSAAQMALLVRQIEIITAVDYIDFYPDGEKSKYYTADEMQEIIDAANNFINGNEVYCNELCLWIKTLTDKDEIESVYYGMDIPEANRSEVLEKMLPVADDETGMLPEEGKDDSEGGEPDDDDDDTNIGAGGEIDIGDPANSYEPADEPEPADDGDGDD